LCGSLDMKPRLMPLCGHGDERNMKRDMIAYKMICMSPFESGGDFARARRGDSSLLMELHAEQEEIRSKRRVMQERLTMYTRQLADCSREQPKVGSKSVQAWLIGAAVAMIFGLLFSVSGISLCGSCGRLGLSAFLLLIGVILAVRAWSEYMHENNDKKNQTGRLAHYRKQCEHLNEEISKLNLREAEIEATIRSANRFM